MIAQHFEDNEIPESATRLIEAAVAPEDGAVTFTPVIPWGGPGRL